MSKRLFDLIVSSLAFLCLSPLIACIALVVRLKLGAPVIFLQIRPGMKGMPFSMLKFRTMADARGENGQLLPDAERLTGLGRVLRSSSLDELPSLWNIIKGDMSLVGPRPLLMEYIPLYSAQQARRHEVRPGLTGWAQVNGRNALSWEEKFEFDLWYVENRSFWLDLRIIWITLVKVARREGISQNGEATMARFEGTRT